MSSVDITHVVALPESQKLTAHDCEGSTDSHLQSLDWVPRERATTVGRICVNRWRLQAVTHCIRREKMFIIELGRTRTRFVLARTFHTLSKACEALHLSTPVTDAVLCAQWSVSLILRIIDHSCFFICQDGLHEFSSSSSNQPSPSHFYKLATPTLHFWPIRHFWETSQEKGSEPAAMTSKPGSPEQQFEWTNFPASVESLNDLVHPERNSERWAHQVWFQDKCKYRGQNVSWLSWGVWCPIGAIKGVI